MTEPCTVCAVDVQGMYVYVLSPWCDQRTWTRLFLALAEMCIYAQTGVDMVSIYVYVSGETMKTVNTRPGLHYGGKRKGLKR